MHAKAVEKKKPKPRHGKTAAQSVAQANFLWAPSFAETAIIKNEPAKQQNSKTLASHAVKTSEIKVCEWSEGVEWIVCEGVE